MAAPAPPLSRGTEPESRCDAASPLSLRTEPGPSLAVIRTPASASHAVTARATSMNARSAGETWCLLGK